MDPDQRTLIQVTLDDAAAADEIFAVLMGEDVESAALVHPAQRQGRAVPGHLARARTARPPSAHPPATDQPRRETRTSVTETPEGPDLPDDLPEEIAEVLTDRDHQRGPAARDAAVLPGLRDERHRRPRPAGRPRRPQAGAPARAVRDVRRRLPAGPAVLQVQPRRRRRDGQVPPARRHGDLRRPGPPGAGLVDALPAGRRAGQLRLARQRPRRGAAVHRVQDGAARHGDGPGHRRGDRRLPGQLRRPDPGADGPAVAVPEPAGQRQRRHRGRHGHEHPAAQPARGRRGHPVAPGAPGGDQGGAARGAHRADPRPGLPDRRDDPRPARHRGGVPHRPRLDHHARGRHRRGDPEPPVPGGHRAALPGQPGQPGAPRSPTWSRTAACRASRTSATRPPVAPASAWSSCSSATRWPRSC